MTAKAKPKNEGRLFAIGDIHGCPDELEAILKSIAPAPGDTVVFVGDYVDRGPSAHDVIELALDLERTQADCGSSRAIRGHHDVVPRDAGNYGESFLFNGGIAKRQLRRARGGPRRRLQPAATIAPDFMNRLATSYLRPPYLFVHAGIMPTRQLRSSRPRTCCGFGRSSFRSASNRRDGGLRPHPHARRDDRPAVRLGIDTGLVYGGKLTCVEFTEGVLYQVQRGHKAVKTRSIPLR